MKISVFESTFETDPNILRSSKYIDLAQKLNAIYSKLEVDVVRCDSSTLNTKDIQTKYDIYIAQVDEYWQSSTYKFIELDAMIEGKKSGICDIEIIVLPCFNENMPNVMRFYEDYLCNDDYDTIFKRILEVTLKFSWSIRRLLQFVYDNNDIETYFEIDNNSILTIMENHVVEKNGVVNVERQYLKNYMKSNELFSQLISKGYSWIHLTYYGMLESKQHLISIANPKDSVGCPPIRTSVNLSGRKNGKIQVA